MEQLIRWSSALLLQVMFTGLVAAFPGETDVPVASQPAEPGFFGIVAMDPWYTYNTDTVLFPNDVNREFLELMIADISRLGAEWIRIEIHAEYFQDSGPGGIDWSKMDWFLNDLVPRYGLKVLVVAGSGMIGDRDTNWRFSHINDPLDENGSNYYIDEFILRVRETLDRYRNTIHALEILNEPNRNFHIALESGGQRKSVKTANYGELIRRSFEAAGQIAPEVQIVVGGMVYDTEENTLPPGKPQSYDLDWLEAVYGSKAVQQYRAQHGRYPFDAVGVHPYYLDPNQIIDYLQQIRDMQIRFEDRTGRLWITEIGYPADPPNVTPDSSLVAPTNAERDQADFMSALFTTVRQKSPFVENIFWFKYEDFPSPNEAHSGWGLVRLRDSMTNYGAFADPWPRKFSYVVYQALARPHLLPMAPVDPPADGDDRYFHETGHTVGEMFIDYWWANGSTTMFGYPLTEPFELAGRTVQYFERARLDHFPEYAGTSVEIQIGLLGTYLTRDRSFERQDPGQTGDNRIYFPETGQYVLGAFRDFWAGAGGLTQFGMPLSPEFEENGVLVQYFERARFEYRPVPDSDAYKVVLGRIGAEALLEPGWFR